MASEALEMVVAMLQSRPIAADVSFQEMRAALDEMAGNAPLPDGATREPVLAGGVPAEWTTAAGVGADATVLYLHGGSYLFGSPRTHADTLARIALATGRPVLAPEYRLAPEHLYPAQLEDALAALHALEASGVPRARIVLAGESAGEHACVTVADQGQGLSDEQQRKVFEKFERLGRSGDGGSGLGLYISRRLARAMNGELTVESAPGQGARFTLTLPADEQFLPNKAKE